MGRTSAELLSDLRGEDVAVRGVIFCAMGAGNRGRGVCFGRMDPRLGGDERPLLGDWENDDFPREARGAVPFDEADTSERAVNGDDELWDEPEPRNPEVRRETGADAATRLRFGEKALFSSVYFFSSSVLLV